MNKNLFSWKADKCFSWEILKFTIQLNQCLATFNYISLRIFVITCYNNDKIYQSPNSASAEREQLRNANAGMSSIKTVNAKYAQKPAKHKTDYPSILIRGIYLLSRLLPYAAFRTNFSFDIN
jgi:hypothetical protein